MAYALDYVYSSGLKATGIFVILSNQGDFENGFPEPKFQTNTSYSQFEKVTVLEFIAELWTATSNQMII